MVQIGNTEWDDELLADRVDVYRKPRRQDISGVNRLDPTTPAAAPELTDIACSIQYAGSQMVIQGIQSGILSEDLISFAVDLSLKPDDLLKTKSPSVVGQTFRVGQARWEQTADLKLYLVRCKQVT